MDETLNPIVKKNPTMGKTIPICSNSQHKGMRGSPLQPDTARVGEDPNKHRKLAKTIKHPIRPYLAMKVNPLYHCGVGSY